MKLTFPSIESLLKKHSVRAKKKFGQNFLTPRPTLEKIIAQLDLTDQDVVVEIGPGLSLMTALTAEKCKHVYAIEFDSDMLAIAKEEFGHIKNITWIHADILKVDLHQFLKAHTTTKSLKVIGNIPYEITSPILFYLLESRKIINKAVLLMQKEVALRLVAKPSTKEYGILSILLNVQSVCKKCFDVSKQSFIPAPKVDSSVIAIDFTSNRFPLQDEKWFKQIVKAAFGKRRKTLRNALLQGGLSLSIENLEKTSDSCNIPLSSRAEDLEISDFVCLAQQLIRN